MKSAKVTSSNWLQPSYIALYLLLVISTRVTIYYAMPTLTEYVSKMSLEQHDNIIDFDRDIGKEINGSLEDGSNFELVLSSQDDKDLAKTTIEQKANEQPTSVESLPTKHIYKPQYLRDEKESSAKELGKQNAEVNSKRELKYQQMQQPKRFDLPRDTARIARITGASKSVSNIEDIIEPSPNGHVRTNSELSGSLRRKHRPSSALLERSNSEKSERDRERLYERIHDINHQRVSPSGGLYKDRQINRKSWNGYDTSRRQSLTDYDYGPPLYREEQKNVELDATDLDHEVDSPISQRQRWKRRSLTPELVSSLSSQYYPGGLSTRHSSLEQKKKPEFRSPGYNGATASTNNININRMLNQKANQSYGLEETREDLINGSTITQMDDKTPWITKKKIIQELQLDYMLVKKALKALEERVELFEKIHHQLDLKELADSKDASTQVSPSDTDSDKNDVAKKVSNRIDVLAQELEQRKNYSASTSKSSLLLQESPTLSNCKNQSSLDSSQDVDSKHRSKSRPTNSSAFQETASQKMSSTRTPIQAVLNLLKNRPIIFFLIAILILFR